MNGSDWPMKKFKFLNNSDYKSSTALVAMWINNMPLTIQVMSYNYSNI